jgi:signal transduction histidine kinase
METQNTNMPLLELLLRPAFYVSQGRITQINRAAAPYLLSEGTEILSLLATGEEEYQAFTQGCLYLTLSIGGQSIGATVVTLDQQHLFLLEQPGERTELRSLALAARELRGPLAGISATTSQFTNADPVQLAQLNHRMHQMMRIVSNMSDAALYCDAGAGPMEYAEICSFLQELLCKTAEQLSEANIHLEYDLPAAPIYTLADTDKLERAVYNLISNAAKHTAPGGRISLRLVHRGRLYLSVTDDGPRMDHEILANVYTRYLRTPSVLEISEGIGLGMVLVKATATLHGGTVLIDHPEGRGNRITMTLQLRQAGYVPVRSPMMRIDYAGERDHGLQELADVLPARLYAPEKT